MVFCLEEQSRLLHATINRLFILLFIFPVLFLPGLTQMSRLCAREPSKSISQSIDLNIISSSSKSQAWSWEVSLFSFLSMSTLNPPWRKKNLSYHIIIIKKYPCINLYSIKSKENKFWTEKFFLIKVNFTSKIFFWIKKLSNSYLIKTPIGRLHFYFYWECTLIS